VGPRELKCIDQSSSTVPLQSQMMARGEVDSPNVGGRQKFHSFVDSFRPPGGAQVARAGNNLSFIGVSSFRFMGNTRRIVLSTLGLMGDLIQ